MKKFILISLISLLTFVETLSAENLHEKTSRIKAEIMCDTFLEGLFPTNTIIAFSGTRVDTKTMHKDTKIGRLTIVIKDNSRQTIVCYTRRNNNYMQFLRIENVDKNDNIIDSFDFGLEEMFKS